MEERCKINCKDIKEVKDAVFGEHQDGLTYQMKQMELKKVDKTCLRHYIKKPPIPIIVALIVITFGVISSSISAGYKVLFTPKEANYVYAKKDIVTKHAERLKVLETNVTNTNNNLSDLKSQVGKLDNKFEKLGDKIDNKFKDQKKDMEKNLNELKFLIRQMGRHR